MVSVVAAPTITAQPSGAQACEGKAATISLSATGTSLTYQWQADIGTGYINVGNGGVYSGVATNQLSIANVTGLDNVRYQCIVTSGGSCPVTSNAVALVVNASPAVVNQTQAVCELTAGSGTSVVDLTALNSPIVSGASGYTISWYANAALSNPVADPTNAETSNNTMFYARVVNNSTGCSSAANASITVDNKPSGSGIVSGPLTLCTNVESTYTVTGIDNATEYQWQASSGLEVLSQNGASVTIQAVSGTSGTITVTGENSCGNGGSGNLVLQVLPGPDVEIVAPSEVIVNETANFSLETSAAAFQSILWDFGDNGSATEAAPEHIYTADGTFAVTLTVTDNANCEATRTKTIIVSPVPDLNDTNIKNVITANGDDSNGVLYIENIEKYPSNQVVLLDRWGVEVFRKENYVNDWDARKNGEFLPAGQYVCVVKLNETGKVFTRTVSIIKRK